MSRPKRPIPHGPLPDLSGWLAAHPSGSSERLALSRDEVHLVFQELRKLGQSADRLRKQNRKIRRRFLALRELVEAKLAGDEELGALAAELDDSEEEAGETS